MATPPSQFNSIHVKSAMHLQKIDVPTFSVVSAAFFTLVGCEFLSHSYEGRSESESAGGHPLVNSQGPDLLIHGVNSQ